MGACLPPAAATRSARAGRDRVATRQVAVGAGGRDIDPPAADGGPRTLAGPRRAGMPLVTWRRMAFLVVVRDGLEPVCLTVSRPSSWAWRQRAKRPPRYPVISRDTVIRIIMLVDRSVKSPTSTQLADLPEDADTRTGTGGDRQCAAVCPFLWILFERYGFSGMARCDDRVN